MVIPAQALFAASMVLAAVPPLRLVPQRKAFAVPMFHSPLDAGRSAELAFLRPKLPNSDAEPSFTCHIIAVRPDPGIDPKIVVEAPAIDPRVVRKSVCTGPNND